LVFVVDDEVLIAEILAMILLANGYSALPFMDPVKALEYTDTRSSDLLLSDVRMPQLSGIDLGSRLQRNARSARSCCFPRFVKQHPS